MSYNIQACRKKKSGRGVDLKKIIETSSSSSGMCSVNELCCFFLIGWQCGSVRQEGVGVWLFFSLKTVLKHHSCITVEERERERDAHLHLYCCCCWAQEESGEWLHITDSLQQSWYRMIMCSEALHFKHLGECIGSGGALWLLCMSENLGLVMEAALLLDICIATQMAQRHSWPCVQLMWHDWNWSRVCATLLWWS